MKEDKEEVKRCKLEFNGHIMITFLKSSYVLDNLGHYTFR